MSSVTVNALVKAKYAENAQTTQYTSPLCKTIIDKMTATNVTAGNVTFAANVVASAGSASAANNLLPTRTIAPGETYPCPEIVGHTIEASDFISTLAGAASSIVIYISGRKIT